MKKKTIKEYGKLFNKEVTIIINDKWKPSPSNLALRKLAKANESLSKMKGLPKLSHEK
jgi:hypothetical protein